VTVDGHLAVLVIHLHFPDVSSLKGKRRELRPVKAHLQGRMGAAVAEVGHHDLWQRATLVAVLAGRSPGRVGEGADRVERWLDARFPQGASVERTLVSLEDLRG
jgi:uncharacterized protein